MQVELAERVSRDANVVQFYGTSLPPSGGCVLMVMEFMPVRDCVSQVHWPRNHAPSTDYPLPCSLSRIRSPTATAGTTHWLQQMAYCGAGWRPACCA